ncbi:DUF6123 family protein [Fictibacillus aquaticus]|uniref:Group-specific protein n=1 Tax=Fictibacillus aquaticus TaxID=2021314 RepID=A0A235FBH8_9BACL|nr:DUF6123 family protein [Fictibacillus aquaticus]OYD58698.1 hypothetical protein CGZ90_02010 [Fictibacillus aquaticus]
MKPSNIENYLDYLSSKGIRFEDGQVQFFLFGKHYCDASDVQVECAIEWMLKHQFGFDPSYFIELLKRLKEENAVSKKEAYHLFNRITSQSKKHA